MTKQCNSEVIHSNDSLCCFSLAYSSCVWMRSRTIEKVRVRTRERKRQNPVRYVLRCALFERLAANNLGKYVATY